MKANKSSRTPIALADMAKLIDHFKTTKDSEYKNSLSIFLFICYSGATLRQAFELTAEDLQNDYLELTNELGEKIYKPTPKHLLGADFTPFVKCSMKTINDHVDAACHLLGLSRKYVTLNSARVFYKNLITKNLK